MTGERRPRYVLRAVLMHCTNCGYKRLQKMRGTCHKCGEGMMTHDENAVRVYVEEPQPAVKPEYVE